MSTQVWRPWDADDQEQDQRRILRDGLPPTLMAPVLGWLHKLFDASYSTVDLDLATATQSALRVDLGIRPPTHMDTGKFIANIQAQGADFILRVVDFLLAQYRPDNWLQPPPDVQTLAFHFDANSSSVVVAQVDGVYRLRYRLPEGVEQAAQEAVDEAGDAGRLLAKAWREAHALNPNPGEAMQLAVRAVEAIAAPKVVPRSKKGFIGEIAQTIEAQAGWGLVLWSDEGYPDHRQLIALMLRTLAKAQSDRHGAGHSEPTVEEARAHVQLAATLVSWFATDAIRRPD